MKQIEHLANWVKNKHQGQLIKRTAKPYFTHLIAVAEMVAPVTFLGYEVGLCHDILEDTETTIDELRDALTRFNYDKEEVNYITERVIELTNVFTAANYPGLTKDVRKEKEALRLSNMSPGAQTVKYSDLIDNIKWVLQYDQKHAEIYLRKKQLLLYSMTKGDKGLHQKTLETINKGLINLKMV
jgi:(p)ppGpp synthase/HD superfamily hydrolase